MPRRGKSACTPAWRTARRGTGSATWIWPSPRRPGVCSRPARAGRDWASHAPTSSGRAGRTVAQAAPRVARLDLPGRPPAVSFLRPMPDV